jgi:hypothetical protein
LNPEEQQGGRALIIISLGRVWVATIGGGIAIVIGWAIGLVDDSLFQAHFLLWVPAIALTIDGLLRRAWLGLYGSSPFSEFED